MTTYLVANKDLWFCDKDGAMHRIAEDEMSEIEDRCSEVIDRVADIMASIEAKAINDKQAVLALIDTLSDGGFILPPVWNGALSRAWDETAYPHDKADAGLGAVLKK